MKKQGFVETKKKPFFENYNIPKLEYIILGIALFYLLAMVGEFLLRLENKTDLIQEFFNHDFGEKYQLYSLVFFIFIPPIFFIYISPIYILMLSSDFLINDKFKEFFTNNYNYFKDAFNVAFFIASLVPILISYMFFMFFVFLNMFYQQCKFIFYQITSGDYKKRFRIVKLSKNPEKIIIKTTEIITAITMFFGSEHALLYLSRDVLWLGFNYFILFLYLPIILILFCMFFIVYYKIKEIKDKII